MLKIKKSLFYAESPLLLESAGYKYIIGARIKSESNEVKQWILSLEKQDSCFYELGRLPRSRLIVGYSENRAQKDRYNRVKGVKRLKTAYQSGTITKENINKRDYNKFLEISENVQVVINQEKINNDEKWDGLKGYLTNTVLPAEIGGTMHFQLGDMKASNQNGRWVFCEVNGGKMTVTVRDSNNNIVDAECFTLYASPRYAPPANR